MQNFILLCNISLVLFEVVWEVERKKREMHAVNQALSCCLYFQVIAADFHRITEICAGLYLSKWKDFMLFAYLVILLNIFLLGWFCEPFCWRWCDRSRTSTGRNSVFNQPRTDCVEAHHWSLGSQWMSYHHRLVFAEDVSHLILVLCIENIFQIGV